MRFPIYSLLFALFFITNSAAAEQEVGGIKINYLHLFKKDIETASLWMSKAPDSVRRMVISMEVYTAPPSNGIGEVRLIRVHYAPTVIGNIDGVAEEAAKRLAALDGVTKFQKQIVPLSVSGFDARHMSISADRRGGKLGGEFLIVYKRNANVMLQMQFLFGKKKGVSPFAPLSIEEERRYAKDLLSTIRIAP